MKIKAKDLTGTALDWAVCLAQGLRPVLADDKGRTFAQVGTEVKIPSRDWAQGGPIIEREHLSPVWAPLWKEWVIPHPKNAALGMLGPTMLITAMRCFVASKLGDEVDVPDELAP